MIKLRIFQWYLDYEDGLDVPQLKKEVTQFDRIHKLVKTESRSQE